MHAFVFSEVVRRLKLKLEHRRKGKGTEIILNRLELWNRLGCPHVKVSQAIRFLWEEARIMRHWQRSSRASRRWGANVASDIPANTFQHGAPALRKFSTVLLCLKGPLENSAAYISLTWNLLCERPRSELSLPRTSVKRHIDSKHSGPGSSLL